MEIQGKDVLVLGGAGLVGTAVCHEMLASHPASLVVASRQRQRAEQAVERLKAVFPESATRIIAISGDVFIRAEWQEDAKGSHPRAAVLSDPDKRRRLIADILDPLDEEIIVSSLLTRMIEGRAPGIGGRPAHIILDCMNTAPAVGYPNIYQSARRLADRAGGSPKGLEPSEQLEILLASLYVPQLVRHVQLLHEAMRRAGTQAYLKVGTSGTGGMGLNIPYTHGEERPSRLLLSKAALAGAQSLLTFLMARTPGGPSIVKEVKPTAVIGWRQIAYGPIRSSGGEIAVYDCPPDQTVSTLDPSNLVKDGDFGEATGERVEGVYIHTGENGQFSAGEFTAITALGQMELVTAEEIARTVVSELRGGNTGRDVIAALDGAVMGPSYRGGFLREAAINRLKQLESEHGESVAFEILGPPRLSKLLFEAYLLKQVFKTLDNVLSQQPDALAMKLARHVCSETEIRKRMISIGIPILLPDGERLLRGPLIKSEDAYHGWADLTPANMKTWQGRLEAIRRGTRELADDTSSRGDRNFASSRNWLAEEEVFDVGEVVAWIFNREEGGQRGKP